MISVEQRLVRDIAAVTRGVVVTERHLKDARSAIDERIDSRRRRDRRLRFGAAAAVVAVVALVGYATFRSVSGDEGSSLPTGPAPSTSADPDASFLVGQAPTPELVNGVWRVDDGILLVRFAPPSKVYFDNGGELLGDPRVQGTYVIDGDLITVSVLGGRALCGGQTFAMRASLPGPGAMRFVFTQSGSGACIAAPGEQWELEQVLPTSAEMAGFEWSAEQGWQAARDTVDLRGVWMAEGGGYVLELDPVGGYFVVDESGEPVDRGQWSQQGAELTLTSSAASSECTDGDLLVLRDLEMWFGGATAMRGTVDQNLCGGAWATKVWGLLPDARNQ